MRWFLVTTLYLPYPGSITLYSAISSISDIILFSMLCFVIILLLRPWKAIIGLRVFQKTRKAKITCFLLFEVFPYFLFLLF